MSRVTVLMSVHNGEAYLREAVDSILGQTFGDFELLVVEDGSTDGTREILAGYVDPRLRVVENDTNVGLARSLNRGLRLATGRFVARQDADDVSEPERLAKQVAFLDGHGDVALAGTCYRKIDARGAILALRRLPLDDTAIRWAMLFYCPFVHTSVMFRRAEVVSEVGLYDESLAYSEDYELWSRIARRFRLANLPEALVRFRDHPASMTATYGERTQEGARLREAALGRLLGAEVPPAAHAAMHALVVGVPYRGPARDLVSSARQLLRLHSAFCSATKLGAAECQSHEREVRRCLRRHLAKAARTLASARHYGDAIRLLLAALATSAAR